MSLYVVQTVLDDHSRTLEIFLKFPFVPGFSADVVQGGP